MGYWGVPCKARGQIQYNTVGDLCQISLVLERSHLEASVELRQEPPDGILVISPSPPPLGALKVQLSTLNVRWKNVETLEIMMTMMMIMTRKS